jgi:predicted homoserine dehydrogenase-like protein
VVGQLMPAADSLSQNCLPLGLAHGWKLLRAVPAGQPVKWTDVAVDANSTAVRVRREMENVMRDGSAAASRRALEETAR